MASSIPTEWPTTSNELHELLEIHNDLPLKCHGRGIKKPTCNNDISKANKSKISKLVQDIVAAGSLNQNASVRLNELAHLVMCQRRHQRQGGEKFTTWERRLRSIEPERITVSQPPQPRIPTEDTHDHTLRPYARTKSTLEINRQILAKLLAPLRDSQFAAGCVYAYRYPENHIVNGHPSSAFVKIGYSQNPTNRMSQIRRECGYSPDLVAALEMPHHRLFESIVHAQLHNERKRQSGGCDGCGREHKEWFEHDVDQTIKLVGMWADWAQLKPYDEKGLLRRRWVKALKEVDLQDPGCWRRFVYGGRNSTRRHSRESVDSDSDSSGAESVFDSTDGDSCDDSSYDVPVGEPEDDS